jgi:hypothetical protein
MRQAELKADGILLAFPQLDPETKNKLREAIAHAIVDERRVANSEIQRRLGCLRFTVVEDLDLVRREIETLLQPTPIL